MKTINGVNISIMITPVKSKKYKTHVKYILLESYDAQENNCWRMHFNTQTCQFKATGYQMNKAKTGKKMMQKKNPQLKSKSDFFFSYLIVTDKLWID